MKALTLQALAHFINLSLKFKFMSRSLEIRSSVIKWTISIETSIGRKKPLKIVATLPWQ
jgi:hypothetical protein